MKPAKGYYSIIQYCPDLSRFEAANVGVLVFRPEPHFLKALTAHNNQRIIRFFGAEGHDWKRVNALKRGIEDRLQKESAEIRTLDDLREFIALRANVVQITTPLPMKVADPELDLLELYQKIVGGPATHAPTKSLRRHVGETLFRAGLKDKLVEDVKVRFPVLDKDLVFPFGYQNGRFNVINPVRFRGEDPEQSFGTACKYAVEGQTLAEQPHPQWGKMQLVVVGDFRAEDHDSPRIVRSVFDKYGVKLFGTQQLPQLVDEIRRTGRVISGTSKS